jgi:hypothetical protein
MELMGIRMKDIHKKETDINCQSLIIRELFNTAINNWTILTVNFVS